MNPRERVLAVFVLGVLVVVVLGFLAYQAFWLPFQSKTRVLANLLEQEQNKRTELAKIQAEVPRLQRWRQLSLPAGPDLARREYEKYLTEMLRQHNIAGNVASKVPDTKSSPQLKDKTPVYTKLSFHVVSARGTLDNIVGVLEGFYRTSALHQIKNLTVTRPLTNVTPGQQQRGGQQPRRDELEVTFTIEALIVSGAENRSYLLPNIDRKLLAIDAATALRRGPSGLGLALWAAGPTGPGGAAVNLAQPPRNYDSIAAKNIFLPPEIVSQRDPNPEPEVDATRFVRLVSITDNGRLEAYLYDPYNNRQTRLRTTSGFDTFRIKDNRDQDVVRGKVVRILLEEREVVFKVEDAYFAVHSGQTLAEALRKPLTEERVKALGLSAAAAEEEDR